MNNFWKEMSPQKRMFVAGFGLFAGIMIVAGLLSVKEAGNSKKVAPAQETRFAMPGQKDVSLMGISTEVASIKDATRNEDKNTAMEIEAQKGVIASLQQQIADIKSKPSTVETETAKQLLVLQKSLDELKAKKTSSNDGAPSLDSKLDDLPPGVDGDNNANTAQAVASAPAVVEKPKIRIITGDTVKPDDAAAAAGTRTAYIPTGAMFEGVLLNGMDAPTSAVTQKNPVPALIRVKTDAVLPNGFRHDVRECFVIVSGFGVLSDERAQLRTESLSCIKTDGSTIDQKINGYVVGEDGKVGMRGRLVSKQGQLIAKSLISGILEGVGALMQPMTVPQMNINPGSNMQYQMPSANEMAMGGLGGGIQSVATNVSKFYLDMARQIFPVIEIDAGRKVTIVILKGFEMSTEGHL